jgi:hypothetical protein
VYATDGDDTLGGSDIDLCLFKILKERIVQVAGVDITASAATQEAGAAQPVDAADSASMCTAAAVHTMAEDVKKALTYAEEVQFKCTLPSAKKVCVFALSLQGFCAVFTFDYVDILATAVPTISFLPGSYVKNHCVCFVHLQRRVGSSTRHRM